MAKTAGYSAKRLSEIAQCSDRQLRRYTIRVFGCTPHVLLLRLRLLPASMMLRQHRSVKRVSMDLGFKQISHFSREFKRCFGVSPRDFLEREDRLAAQLRDASGDVHLTARVPNELDRPETPNSCPNGKRHNCAAVRCGGIRFCQFTATPLEACPIQIHFVRYE
jgi:AraC-like DNA-binding protein